MNLREEMIAAQQRGDKIRVEKDMVNVDKTIGNFADGLKDVLREMTRMYDVGEAQSSVDAAMGSKLKLEVRLSHLKRVDEKDILAMEGYRKLYDFCSSEAVDIAFNFDTSRSLGQQGTAARINIFPREPFSRSSFGGFGIDQKGAPTTPSARPAPPDGPFKL